MIRLTNKIRTQKRRICLISVAALMIVLTVLFPLNISQTTPQAPVYRVTIGNTAMAHDAESTCDGVDDHVQFQQLLDSLPADVAGRIEVEAGYYSFGTGETVTRNITNVTIIGVGGLVSFDGDDTTPIFTAGGDNWTFENIVTDAGGIDTGSTSGYLFRNVLIGSTLYSFVTDNIDIEDHNARHESNGDDEIKLDNLGTPDDNTDLDATTGYHGLLPKLAGNTSLFLRSDGNWTAPIGTGDMERSTYDTDEDGLIDTDAGGTEWDSSAVTGVAYVTTGTWSNRATGIADTNIVIVSGTVNSGEHCRFTATGIEGLTSAELLGDLSGDAGSAFDWNSQDLTNVGTVDGRDVSTDGTKLDGIEAGADITDAINVDAAGALMDSDTDNVDDTHINWGSGAGQVDADDILESGTRYWAGESGADITDAINVDAAGALMESDYNATTFLYATLDNTPEVKTPAEVLAILSGQAGAAFDWNGQNLINVGTVDGRDVSTDGTKLDGIEAGADVTDATNVDAAGALMESDYDATTFLYATSDNTPEVKTPAEVLAILSGQAGSTFDWNGQVLADWGIESGTTVDASATTGQFFLHTPTGRTVLLQYDGSNWIPIISFGTMAVYVDATDGTDGINYGTAADSSAFATVQYAIDCIAGSYSGDVVININGESYDEDITIQGKSATGAYTITLQGTLSQQDTATMDSAVKGTGATQGSITDTGEFGSYDDMLMYANSEYRIIDSDTANTATIVGCWSGVPSGTWIVYDWATDINKLVVAEGQIGVVLRDMELDTFAALTVNQYGESVFHRCNILDSTYGYGKMTIDTCYMESSTSHVVRVQYHGLVSISRTKLYVGANSLRGIFVYDFGMLGMSAGSIIDSVSTTGTTGIYLYGLSEASLWVSATTGYNRIRNLATGMYATVGGKGIYTSNNQYSGNTADETADAASFGYID